MYATCPAELTLLDVVTIISLASSAEYDASRYALLSECYAPARLRVCR
jgi:hypothetical protein